MYLSRPLVALYKTFRGGEWVFKSLDSIGQFVDKIVAVHSRVGWVPTPLKNNCIGRFNEWMYVNRRTFDYHSIVGYFATQEEQYRLGWEYIRVIYPDALVLLIDVDELWEEDDLRQAITFIANLNSHDAYSCKLYTYVKSPYYRVTPPETCTPVVFVVAARVPDLLGIRGNGIKDKVELPDVRMHHYTYVRKREVDIEFKFRSSEAGDRAPSRPDWLQTVWPAIPNVKNFHPTRGHETSWQSIEIIKPEELPAAVRGRENFNNNDRIWEVHRNIFEHWGFTLEIMWQITDVAFLCVWDAFHLFCAARQMPDGGTFLEIGGNRGGSMICVDLGLKSVGKKGKLLTIEPFFGDTVKREEFFENTQGMDFTLYEDTAEHVHFLIPDASVDLLFIDGSHTYENVKQDITQYWPKLRKDGVLLGHDFDFGLIMQGAADDMSGLPRAVIETLLLKEITKLYRSSVFEVKKLRDDEAAGE